jgi:hypothetical protein
MFPYREADPGKQVVMLENLPAGTVLVRFS